MPWATVAANVRLPLKLVGLGASAQARVDAALARVGLSGFAQSYPRELSGGMRPGCSEKNAYRHMQRSGVSRLKLRRMRRNRYRV